MANSREMSMGGRRRNIPNIPRKGLQDSEEPANIAHNIDPRNTTAVLQTFRPKQGLLAEPTSDRLYVCPHSNYRMKSTSLVPRISRRSPALWLPFLAVAALLALASG